MFIEETITNISNWFIPTLILVKCNPYNVKVTKEFVLGFGIKGFTAEDREKVWRLWLGIVSSNDLEEEAVIRSKDYEGKTLGLILINPS